MSDLSFPSFADFFRDVHGQVPYKWQIELASFVAANGKFPDRIVVPTGLGKTAAIDVAVWALAKQIAEKRKRTIGQRIFHVVERRIVVDGAYQHVERLKNAVSQASSESTKQVAYALSQLQVSEGKEPLVVTSFHGSKHDQYEWLSAVGAKIIITTATQFTMRILGQAPGVSSSMRPVHAGLTGVDSIVLFDEPQLAAVQVSTLKDVAALQNQSSIKLGVPSMQISLLGATIPPTLIRETDTKVELFPKTETDHLRTLWNTPRPVESESFNSPSSKDSTKKLISKLVSSVFSCEEKQGISGAKTAVIVNSVQVANSVTDLLQTELKKRKDPRHVKLITSRMRAADRPVTPQLLASSDHILVATQTVEVGADFSVDVLVTEIAPWPSLLQRFGRVNRDGKSSHPIVKIIVPKLEKDDLTVSQHIYGKGPLVATEKLISSIIRQQNSGEKAKSFSASLNDLNSINSFISTELLEEVWPEPSRTAPFTFDLAKHFLATSTPYTPPLDVDAWLTGPDSLKLVEPVTIAWRSDLELLSITPLQPSETIEVPIAEALSLITATKKQVRSATSDLISSDVGLFGDEIKALKKEDHEQSLDRVRISYGEDWIIPTKVENIRPGCMLVLDSKLGGYSTELGMFSTEKGVEQEEVPDVSFALTLQTSRPIWAPLNENSYKTANGTHWREIEETLSDESITQKTRRKLIAGWIKSDFPEYGAPRLRFSRKGNSVLICRSSQNTDNSSHSPVTLSAHSSQVKLLTEKTASKFDINEDLLSDLSQAAFLHDHGKAISSFQTMLGKTQNDELLAKSYARQPISSKLALLPDFYDHAAAAALAAERTGSSPLTCHLIAAHHGGARGVNRNNVGTAMWLDRYVELSREFGPWGLCWLESLVRISDWHASEFPDFETNPIQLNEEVISELINSAERPDRLFPVRKNAKRVPLTGLVLQKAKTINWFTALGALALVTIHDSDAALAFENGIPVIYTDEDVNESCKDFHSLWLEFFDLTDSLLRDLGKTSLLEKHNKLAISPELVEFLYQYDWPPKLKQVASALWCPHLPRCDLEKTYNAASWLDPLTNRFIPETIYHGKYLLPSGLLAKNSTIFKIEVPFDSDAIWQPGKGWSHLSAFRGAGGLDMPEAGSEAFATRSISRSSLVSIALFGVLNLGTTLAPMGNGTYSYKRNNRKAKIDFDSYALPVNTTYPFKLSEYEFLIHVAPQLKSESLLIADISQEGEKQFSSVNSRIVEVK